ncbi:hypothetical protein BDV25DRAFT_168538 [Aspergillus avenaceus]|uniref:Rhodopsin domain-containing protein n=1 Tax=Aspergillus avenaceus TaxID=36643 RepID=A0A5N6TPS4_ASPAV|nr:hypothetical protein BDV25DRAFT_168538 [Aspergillus avenaceus]
MAYNVSTELFTEWAIGLVVIAVRLYTRWSIGKKNFYWDDFCLLVAMACWTVFTVTLYYCNDVYGSNIGLTAETAELVPDSKVATLRKGSICAFIAWVTYIVMVWAFKGVLVFLYNRLTNGLAQHRLTLIVGLGTICLFLVSILFHLCHCTPIQMNWQVKPFPGDRCTLRQMNYILIETLSIINDLAIMCVPIPLIMAAKIPSSQKFILCALFSSGIFVMICSVLRAYYSVKDINHLATALGWASREAFVSCLIVCAPGIKPLFNRIGWFKSYGSSNNYGQNYTSTHKSRTGRFTSRHSRDFNTLNSTNNETHPYELSSSVAYGGQRTSSGDSQEHIIEATPHKRGDSPENGIVVTTDVMLAHEDSPPGTRS